MKSAVSLLLLYTLAACATVQGSARHVPPEEAAWFKFGSDLPTGGRLEVPGAQAAALQLAMEHFLPRGRGLPPGADRTEVCIHQRQSWDAEVAPGAEGVLLVRFSLSPGACYRWGPPLDMAHTYAVDTRSWRLVEKDPMQPPPELPSEGRTRLAGNAAASLLLALEDFLPVNTPPPEDARPEESCLHRRESYDVTLASGPEGVVQVRFALNEGACPTDRLRGSSTALARLNMTVHAVDVRTMRILAVGSHLPMWQQSRPLESPPPAPLLPAPESGSAPAP